MLDNAGLAGVRSPTPQQTLGSKKKWDEKAVN